MRLTIHMKCDVISQMNYKDRKKWEKKYGVNIR